MARKAWIAWLENPAPIQLVLYAWSGHVELSASPWQRVDELRAKGHVATVATSQRAAYAWVSDQRRVCAGCMNGLGRHLCDDCHASRLERQLRASLKGAS